MTQPEEFDLVILGGGTGSTSPRGLRDLSTDPVVTCVAEVWIYGDAPFLK